MGLVLAISSSLLNITLKQYQIAGIAEASETAFHAANAGIECAQYWDRYETSPADGTVNLRDAFEIGANDEEINCMGVTDTSSVAENSAGSGQEQEFEFTWRNANDDPYLCTKLSIFKFYENPSDDGNATGPSMSSAEVSRTCPEGVVCTVMQSRGYNAACNSLTNARTVERELILVY